MRRATQDRLCKVLGRANRAFQNPFLTVKPAPQCVEFLVSIHNDWQIDLVVSTTLPDFFEKEQRRVFAVVFALRDLLAYLTPACSISKNAGSGSAGL